MTNIIIHGDNLSASREYLLNLKNNHKGEIINIDGSKTNPEQLTMATQSMSLFDANRMIVAENILSAVSKNKTNLNINYLLKNNITSQIVLWEAKELSKTVLNKFTSWQIKQFKIPKILFSFLENIRPDNQGEIFDNLNQIRKKESEDFIFLMIVRQIRLLLLAISNNLSGMPSWMSAKIYKQANQFSQSSLLSIYKKLLLIDIGQKTGASAWNLRAEVDLLLLSL